jgi:hypothetical protein
MKLQLLNQVKRSNGCGTESSWRIFTLGRTVGIFDDHNLSNTAVQMLSAIERRLLCLDAVHSPENTSEVLQHYPSLHNSANTEADHVLESLHLACDLNFSAPGQSPSLASIGLLKFHLNATSLETSWQPFPGALLFCLVVGMAASKATSYRTWFLANVIRLTTNLAFGNWDGLRECLWSFSELDIVD